MREYREESRRLEQRECVSDSNALHKSFEFDAARIMQVKFPISSRSICLKIAIGILVVYFYGHSFLPSLLVMHDPPPL